MHSPATDGAAPEPLAQKLRDMGTRRLRVLFLSQLPPSPPRFGAQARMHGLLSEVAQRHDVTAVSLFDESFDAAECERVMRSYCNEVVLVANPRGRDGGVKRMDQLRSLASLQSFERHRFSVPALQRTLDRLMQRDRFDVVNLEFHYLAHYRLRQAPGGAPPPALVLDTHEIAHDLARQIARSATTWTRRAYGGINWRKLRKEELEAFRAADGLCVCSVADQQRLLADLPSARTAVIPNAADVERYQPQPTLPPADGRTVVFFGLLSTFPNVDGVTYLLREIWPKVAAARPEARCRIIGASPPVALRELAGPGVEFTGFIEDLRPHLASASAIVVPLRVGSGTRLKIVEGMAMGKAIVSTTLGAEGIDAVPGQDLLLADAPDDFAAAVIRLLDDRPLAERIGRSARRLAVERYSWSAAARALERFFGEILAARSGSP